MELLKFVEYDGVESNASHPCLQDVSAADLQSCLQIHDTGDPSQPEPVQSLAAAGLAQAPSTPAADCGCESLVRGDGKADDAPELDPIQAIADRASIPSTSELAMPKGRPCPIRLRRNGRRCCKLTAVVGNSFSIVGLIADAL